MEQLSTMKLSETGKNIIKHWEGCELEAYYSQCPSNVLTIGYGHTFNVKEGQIITKEQADKLFDNDIVAYEFQVKDLNLKGINQNQFDSIVSFVYNLGIGNFINSTLYKKIRKDPNDNDIELEFAKWRMGGSPLQVLPGLVKRRKMEADHYFGVEISF